MQELGVDKGVASEAAALLEEGKGALLTPSSFRSKSVRGAIFFVLKFSILVRLRAKFG